MGRAARSSGGGRQYLRELEDQSEDQGDCNSHIHYKDESMPDHGMFQIIFMKSDFPPGKFVESWSGLRSGGRIVSPASTGWRKRFRVVREFADCLRAGIH